MLRPTYLSEATAECKGEDRNGRPGCRFVICVPGVGDLALVA